MFGPLLATIILTAQNIHLSAIPPAVQYLGQLFIGWSLGSKFTPGFFKRAPRFLTTVTLTTLAGLLLTTAAAWALSRATQLPYPAVLLGMAPGGIAADDHHGKGAAFERAFGDRVSRLPHGVRAFEHRGRFIGCWCGACAHQSRPEQAHNDFD